MEHETSSTGLPIERGLVKTSAGYIHYRAAGRGNPIVLLHINQQSSALYLEMMEVLARVCRPIAIDYPGHGMSDHVAQQPWINDYARWIVEVLDALNIETTCVLGEAVGAVIATELAGAFASRIEKLVLVNCPWHRPAKEAHAPAQQAVRPADSSGFPLTRTLEFVLEHNPQHAPVSPTQSWMDRVNLTQIESGRSRWQGLGAVSAYDISAGLPRVRQPALLMIAEHFGYMKDSHQFAAHKPDIVVEIVRNARFCTTWEHAESVGNRAIEFCGLNRD
jgi:pimeloyl-ACP methyl ester carboxylesterase